MTTVQPIPEQGGGSSLLDLIAVVSDGHRGFSQVAESLAESGHSELAAEMREFAEQRSRFAVELRETAVSHGRLEDTEGSTAGSLHRAWVALKDALTGDSAHALLAAAEQGEDHALRQYDRTLEASLSEEMRRVVGRQREEMQKSHDRVRELRDRHA